MVPARASRRSVGLLTLPLAVLALSACATDFEARLAEAEALRTEAADKDAEWIDTARLIGEAREAAARGDTDTAMALVDEARFQAEAAILQAEFEEEAWQQRVIRPSE